MKKFKLETYEDVIAVAETFGRGALDHAIERNTLTSEANQLIFDCIAWAANQVVYIDSVNDGNIEYTIDAVFQANKVCGHFITQLDDIQIIRLGFGAYTLTVVEAMQQGVLSPQSLRVILATIARRNKAAKALNL